MNRALIILLISLAGLLSIRSIQAADPRGLQRQDGAADKRIALVIGNGAYKESPLKNPANDARDMAAALRKLGFEVIEKRDASQKDMNRAIAQFGEKLNADTVALFYYAGHGMQVRGKNYLIPVDAQISGESTVRAEAVDVDAVLDQFAASPLNIVILDACRNNPFERRWRSVGGGLAQMDAPKGVLMAYATAPGKVAADGDGSNGLYTAELLKALNEPGLKVEDVFKRVRARVAQRTADAQIPWESSSLTGDFYFKPGVPMANLAPMPVPGLAGGVRLADLERERAARTQWAEWQTRMQADYDKVAGFQGGADLRAQAWQRFLEAWKADNPYSTEDDRLRAQAYQARRQAEAKPAAPVPANTVPTTFETASKPLVVVNGIAIPQIYGAFIKQSRTAQGAAPENITDDSIREIVIKMELLAQEARRKGLDKDPSVQAAIEFQTKELLAKDGKLLAQEARYDGLEITTAKQIAVEFQTKELLAKATIEDFALHNPISEDVLKAEYDKVKAKAGESEYRPSHIMVPTEEEARALIAKLSTGKKAKFEDLANKTSKDSSAGNGGDLGWMLPVNLVPEFANAMVKLKKGEITKEPVKTQFGWHVIRLDDSRKLDFPPYDKLKGRIAGQVQQLQLRKYVQELRATARVE